MYNLQARRSGTRKPWWHTSACLAEIVKAGLLDITAMSKVVKKARSDIMPILAGCLRIEKGSSRLLLKAINFSI